MRRILWTLVFGFAFPSFGADVLEVLKDPTEIQVSQSRDTHTFIPRDYLCVWRGDEEIACGIVKELLNEKGAILKLDFQKRNVKVGDKVYFAGNRFPAVAARSENAILETDNRSNLRRKYPFEVGLGYVGGQNYQFPYAHFQGMVATRWALGLSSQYVSKPTAAGTLKVYSGLMTANYYGSSYYRGFWFQAGAGVGYLQLDKTAGGNESSTALLGIGTLGWRFGLVGGFNLGLGVGAQYLSQPSSLSVNFDFAPWQAIATADLGLNF